VQCSVCTPAKSATAGGERDCSLSLSRSVSLSRCTKRAVHSLYSHPHFYLSLSVPRERTGCNAFPLLKGVTARHQLVISFQPDTSCSTTSSPHTLTRTLSLTLTRSTDALSRCIRAHSALAGAMRNSNSERASVYAHLKCQSLAIPTLANATLACAAQHLLHYRVGATAPSLSRTLSLARAHD